MKIIHLTTVASSHRYLLLPQLQALLDDGHDVLAVSAPGEDVAVLEDMGVRHLALDGSTRGFDLRADLRAMRSFARIVRNERPDLVHTHNPKPGLYGRVIARMLGVPAVLNTVHGLYAAPEDSLARRSVVYSLEAIAARFSHLELVQNVEDAELMDRTLLAPKGRVRVLGNGIDITRFAPGSHQADHRHSVREELGIAHDAVVVVTVGRLVAEKGMPELFDASASCEAPHELIVIGPQDPEKDDALPPAILDAAVGNGVHLVGHRTDIERLIAAADLFVLASHREGVPRAAMEAAASGLPVIATDIRGCRQVVDHEQTGLLVPVRSPGQLSTAMHRLILDADLRDRFGAAGREKAVAEFDEQLVIDRVRKAYADVTERR